MTKETKRILKVTIKRMADTDPDTSWLGEYSNNPESDYAIDRVGEDGYHDPREFRYFNPNWQNYEGEPEADIRKFCQQDFERMEALNNGQWQFIGIRAEAEIQLSGDVVQTLSSGGLWGIESDSDGAYLEDIQNEQIAELGQQLEAAGFSKRAVAKAFENIEEGNE